MVWRGGVPQDFVSPAHSRQDLQTAIEEPVKATRDHERMINGGADRIPVEADPARLQELADLSQ